jgi:hypothetical protein
MPASGTVGFRAGSSHNQSDAFEFIFRRLMAGVMTATIVRVEAVYNTGGVAPAGVVDLQPLVMQVDGQLIASPRPPVYGVPYGRIQAGANAVIMDPVVGDIGVAVFGDRDLSGVISTQGQAAPGSNRRNSLSDALYVCSILGTKAPTQYVQFDAAGITVTSPQQITLNAPTVAVQGNLTVTEAVIAQGEVTGNSVELSQHVHPDVQSGSESTGKPTG